MTYIPAQPGFRLRVVRQNFKTMVNTLKKAVKWYCEEASRAYSHKSSSTYNEEEILESYAEYMLEGMK